MTKTTDFTINQKFDFLSDLTTMVVNNITPSLVCCGAGGLGKTHSVTATIKENDVDESKFMFIKGYSLQYFI